MADLKETANRHGQDVVAGNMAGLMGDFTPNGMTKVMSMMAAGPITATSYQAKELGNDEFEISYIGDSTSVVWSKWVQVGDKWQIDDVAQR